MDSKLPEYQPVSIELQTEPPDPTIVVPVSSSCMCLTIFSLAAEAHPILIDSDGGGDRGGPGMAAIFCTGGTIILLRMVRGDRF